MGQKEGCQNKLENLFYNLHPVSHHPRAVEIFAASLAKRCEVFDSQSHTGD